MNFGSTYLSTGWYRPWCIVPVCRQWARAIEEARAGEEAWAGKKGCGPQDCDGRWGLSVSSARTVGVRGAVSPNVGKREGQELGGACSREYLRAGVTLGGLLWREPQALGT